MVRELLPRDPEEYGFKEQPGNGQALEFELDSVSQRLRVSCTVVEAEGRRWLRLEMTRFPQPVGFHDTSFVRKAFLGPQLPAAIIYEPDVPALPTGDDRVCLWAPLDEASLPSGLFWRREA
jgi:hypothetical protein